MVGAVLAGCSVRQGDDQTAVLCYFILVFLDKIALFNALARQDICGIVAVIDRANGRFRGDDFVFVQHHFAFCDPRDRTPFSVVVIILPLVTNVNYPDDLAAAVIDIFIPVGGFPIFRPCLGEDLTEAVIHIRHGTVCHGNGFQPAVVGLVCIVRCGTCTS